MIFLGEDGNLYDTNDFRGNFRDFTIYDEGAGGGFFPYEQTIEIVGERQYTGDPAEIARQLQVSQERLQVIGYTQRGEPIYNVVTGDWPPTAGADNTVVVTATTTPPTTDDTEDGQGGLQTGGSGLLGGTPTGQTGGTGEGAGTGSGTGGTGTGGSGTGAGAGAGGIGGTGGGVGGIGGGVGGDGTGDGGGGLDGGLLGGTGVTNTNIPTVFNPEPVEIIDTTDIFTPDIVETVIPETTTVTPVTEVTPTITTVTPVTTTVTPTTNVTPVTTTVTPTQTTPPEMIAYGGGNFFSVPIQQGFYSERGFEPGFMPFGQGYPTFRSGVAGYTPMVPTGFEFGIPQVFAPRVVFQPGVFDPGIIGEDGTWRPTPKPTNGTTPGTGGGTTPGFNEPD